MDESDPDLCSDQDGASDGEAETDRGEEDEVDSRSKKETVVVIKKTKKPKCKKKRSQLTINLCGCKYDSVRRMARKFGMKPVGDEEDWTILWTDTTIVNDRISDMKRYQKINHFPGMIDICRKDQLARNLNRMKKLFPKDYNIFPLSWCLPADFGEFQAYFRAKKNKTFISKPESGCQGRGIFVFKNFKDIKEEEHCVVQQYITKPFILDGFKFDLRIYVLVTSCDPLRVFVYFDGLGRFATVKYHEPTSGNLSEQCMHLTNYAINKSSKDFIRDDDVGSKRKLVVVNKWFVDNGYDIQKIWDDIDDVIIKTLIAVHPKLKHNYRTCFPHHNRGSACFEILGFDVLLDRKLKPWLMEVNHSPSFHTDAPLDKEVKEGLLYDTLNLIDLYANDKRKCIEEDRRRIKERLLLKQRPKDDSPEDEIRRKYLARLEHFESTHSGGFRRIYPNDNEERYAKFFDQGTSLCAETAASRARSELSKQQRVEIETKQREFDAIRKKLTGASRLLEGKKTEELRPESPNRGIRKKRITFNPRRGYFSYTQYSGNVMDNDNCSSVAEEEELSQEPALAASAAKLDNLAELTANLRLLNLAIPEKISDAEELERLEGMRHRDSLVKELGISKQVAATLSSKSSPHPSHGTDVVLPHPCAGNELDSELSSKVYSRLSDSATPPRRRAVPLSADIRNHPAARPYDESFCRTEPGYFGMNLQRSSSSQSVSRPLSRMNPRSGSILRGAQGAVGKSRPMYYFPTQPQTGAYHKLLSTHGHGMKSKITSSSKGKIQANKSTGAGYRHQQLEHTASGLGADLVAVGLSVSSIPIRQVGQGASHLPGKTWTRNMSLYPTTKHRAHTNASTYLRNHF